MTNESFPTQGDRVIEFMEEFLTLGGSFVGQPFIPLEWMKDTIRDIYRLNPETGKRQYRTYLLGVPRKNAKTLLGAAFAAYGLCIDESDSAPQVISAAGDRKQAHLCFDETKRMILGSPDLSEICTTYRDEIHCSRTGGMYRAVSADAGLAHGLNPSLVVVDEYHVHKKPDLFSALQTGSAMRNQPLMLVITTAGWDLDSPLGQLYQYGRKVESGEVDDPTFGFRWYGPRDGETFDVDDEALWEKWNPSFSLMNLDEFRSARKSTLESEFIRYRLNGWTATEAAWLPMGAWDQCFDEDKHLEPNDVVVLGFDGAWRGDSTALVAVRIEDLHVEVVDAWEAPEGDPEWRTPVADVEQAIRDACARYTVREITADPWRFEQSLMTLADEGYPVVDFPTNSIGRMAPATQSFYELVMDKGLSHDGNLSLARHIGNTVVKVDSRGQRVTKEYRSSKRYIDLAVASIIGVHRALHWRDEPEVVSQLIFI